MTGMKLPPNTRIFFQQCSQEMVEQPVLELLKSTGKFDLLTLPPSAEQRIRKRIIPPFAGSLHQSTGEDRWGGTRDKSSSVKSGVQSAGQFCPTKDSECFYV